MSEENLNQELDKEVTPGGENSPETQPSPANPPEVNPEIEAKPQKPSEPQVVIQKEKGFTYYVGFGILFVLGLFLFFVPGLVITYGVNCLVGGLPVTAVWLFSAILSIILWIVFKMKIKGFKKTFYWYLGLAILLLAAFVTIDFANEGHNVSKALNMMVGTSQSDETVQSGVQAPAAPQPPASESAPAASNAVIPEAPTPATAPEAAPAEPAPVEQATQQASPAPEAPQAIPATAPTPNP